MSDWLELELAHHLAPVEAPVALTLPQRRPARRSYTMAPFLAAAAAVALLLLVAPHDSTSPTAVNRYLRASAGIDLPIPSNTRAHIEKARMLEGGVASITYRIGQGRATVWIARASAVRGPAWKAHGQTYAMAYAEPRVACLLCHSNL
jgi:hypothetical protein